MPSLGFRAQFAPLVESGAKRQTIRAPRKDGRDPKPGDRLYLYTGPYRPGERRKIGEAVCTVSARIRLTSRNDVVVHDYDEGLDEEETVQCIAEADGFVDDEGIADHLAMFAFFKKAHGLPFEGVLIRWGELATAEDKG